jgi:hypothetical protein
VSGSDSSTADLGHLQFALSEEHQQQWAAHTFLARSCELTLKRVVDPKPGSALAEADAFYEWEKVSIWVRNYLCAAAEHLCLWADVTAPYKLHPEAINEVRLRPYLLLGRAGLEAAAHALWLVDVSTAVECAQRHIRLMHRDFALHRDALAAGGLDTARVDKRIADLQLRCAGLTIPTTPKDKPPGYEKLVRNAAVVTKHDEDRWSYLWNAASGAAHGQNWFGLEAFDLLTREEYEPGYFRTVAFPDPVFITETIGAACETLQWGTLKWLVLGGHDPDLLRQARRDVFERVPKKTEAP